MRSFALILFSVWAANSPLAAPCSDADLALSEALVTRAQGMNARGIGTKADLLLATGAWLDMKWCAGRIEKADYCSQKDVVLAELTNFNRTSYFSRAGRTDQLAALLHQLIELRELCAQL